MRNPLALIVEDNERSALQRAAACHEHGFEVMIAPSRDDAFRQLRSSPSVDLLVCDINLDIDDPDDKSGLAVAEVARKERPKLTIVGYSGHFSRRRFSPTPRMLQTFNFVYSRGENSAELMDEEIDRWRRQVDQQTNERRASAMQLLKEIQQQYDITDADFCLLQDLIPNANANPHGELPSPEAALERAGYSLRIVDNFDLERRLPRTDQSLRHSIATWVRKDRDFVTVEVYKFPELRGVGKTEEDAVVSLLRLMMAVLHSREFGTIPDFRGVTEETLSYVRQVLGPAE